MVLLPLCLGITPRSAQEAICDFEDQTQVHLHAISCFFVFNKGFVEVKQKEISNCFKGDCKTEMKQEDIFKFKKKDH